MRQLRQEEFDQFIVSRILTTATISSTCVGTCFSLAESMICAGFFWITVGLRQNSQLSA
jgi:hypothetical protein